MPDSQEFLIAVENGELHPPGLLLKKTIRLYKAAELPPVVDQRFADYWAQEVRDRLKRDEATLFCQPIIPINREPIKRVNGRVPASYYEILMRLTKGVGSDRQIIPPSQFFPYIIHQPEVMQELDRWVIRNTMAIAHPGCQYAVNLSGYSLNEEMVGYIRQCLTESGMDPKKLSLEITEAVTLDLEKVKRILYLIKALGPLILSDDFGSDASGLAWVHSFPLDGVKLDISLIKSIAFNEKLMGIVKAIILMASTIGFDVICEGIEDAGALEILSQLKDEALGKTHDEELLKILNSAAGIKDKESIAIFNQLKTAIEERSLVQKDFRLLGQGYFIQRPAPCC